MPTSLEGAESQVSPIPSKPMTVAGPSSFSGSVGRLASANTSFIMPTFVAHSADRTSISQGEEIINIVV